MKIRRDDTVEIIAGKDKGKRGKVRLGMPAEEKVIVADLNIAKKHVKKGDPKRRAGIIDKEMPLHVSNVMLVCSKCNATTRVGYRFLEDGSKVRFCRKCNEVI